MAAPVPDFGASLAYGASPTPVGKLLTFSGSKGMKAKIPCHAQSDADAKYMRGRGQPPEWSFSAQLDKSNVETLEGQLNTEQAWVYTDPDGGKLTCSAAWLSDLEFSTNNDDNTATYTGKIVCNAMPSYATS